MKYEKTSVRQILFAKVGYILMSVLFSAVGIFMILKPEVSTEIICIAAGILLIIFGIIKIIGYFSKDLYRLAFQYDLAFGIGQWWLILLIAVITGLLGLLLLLRPVEGMQAVMILLGCSMLSEGILNLCVAVCTTRVAAVWKEK